MNANIATLSAADLDAVDELMRRNSGTIGFLPLEALRDYLDKGLVLGAFAGDGNLMAYLLYAANRDRFRITQLCVAEDFRGQGLARQLLDALKDSAATQKLITLSCRNDFPAHNMWPTLGFVPIGEKPGRSREGHPLTLWRLILAADDQLELFRANASESVLDVVIDAQVFFDFDEPGNDANRPSKVLISDFFADSVNLWYTDELLSEISRNPSGTEREAARLRTQEFLEAKYDPIAVDIFTESLNRILPSGTRSQRSDINHLAKSASSDIGVFVTRDRRILNKADEIANLVGLHVLSPTELVIRLSELSETHPHEPVRVSGLNLQWRRFSPEEFSNFPFDRFLKQGEALGRLRDRVSSLLSDSEPHDVEVLWLGDESVALRGLAYETNRTLTVTLGRIRAASDGALFGRFLISDAVYRAAKMGLEMINLDISSIPTDPIQGLSDMGFRRHGSQFVRFCFIRCLGREETLEKIGELCPEVVDSFRNDSLSELERSCSPLSVSSDQNYFLIPIREGYAINLIDRERAAQDLFGGNPEVLLRWDNVYYRAATHHNMLNVPARILWYISGDRGEIAYISRLDEVVIDTPKELFRRFRRFGTLEWADLYEMCGRNIDTNLMALKFSHTFPLDRSVPLNEIWEVFDEDGVGRSVQAPTRLPESTFRKLIERGYPEEQ